MRSMAKLGIILLGIFLICSGSLPLARAAADFSKVEEILQARGQMQEGAWVVRFPRRDLQVTINGEAMPTALGFVSWAAFKDMGKKTMIMGDLVLLEEEVFPVISVLEANGLQITALHNHFLHEQPRIMFMHVGGMGDKEALATGLRQALDQTGTVKAQTAASPDAAPAVAPGPGAAPASAPAPTPEAAPAPGSGSAPAPGTAPSAASTAAPAPAPGAGTTPAPASTPSPGAAPAPAVTPTPGAGTAADAVLASPI